MIGDANLTPSRKLQRCVHRRVPWCGHRSALSRRRCEQCLDSSYFSHALSVTEPFLNNENLSFDLEPWIVGCDYLLNELINFQIKYERPNIY